MFSALETFSVEKYAQNYFFLIASLYTVLSLEIENNTLKNPHRANFFLVKIPVRSKKSNKRSGKIVEIWHFVDG